ncbi:unnamed protein product [Eruca vesicaria subsp. sativa]|uniref:Uncharacterized protein n=1 Tax=Eruca vesicaria subsp. sativa TaxID=29727 RepID=A0ABC8J8V2_ERUVS|nr:unnamed protein product [Eruca vesicaria subsp. sativa]
MKKLARRWQRARGDDEDDNIAVLLCCYGAFVFYSISQQFISPWELSGLLSWLAASQLSVY